MFSIIPSIIRTGMYFDPLSNPGWGGADEILSKLQILAKVKASFMRHIQ
jgi:hypothetical protein